MILTRQPSLVDIAAPRSHSELYTDLFRAGMGRCYCSDFSGPIPR